MSNERIALVTGANQGIGFQVAKELVANGWTGLVGARDSEKGQAAAAKIGKGAVFVPLDVTDAGSIAEAADRIRTEHGRLDLLVNNAAISRPPHAGDLALADHMKTMSAATISLHDMRTIWETNVFAVVAITQAMLPLLRAAPAARIVNVGSGAGSLTLNADPAFPYRHMYSPGYAGSKTAMNAVTLSFAIELETEGIRVNAVSPGFTATNLNNFEGMESLEDGAREVVRVALLEGDTRSGAFTAWENAPIPW
ncbi:SDR family NAD(P)-dependent oxidoreductase [Methylobacterium oryzisoli]|uniref:SDR family NAD(P)-dependent oxidoreductase n=1 Tax=Methylobacterium oryzisoli TaxID=3385502 RepID=UPI0038923F65